MSVKSKFASRKFLIAVIILLCTTGLASGDKLDGEATKIIFAMVGFGYGLANVFSKTIDTK